MARKKRGRNISGIIVLDKPKGETSNRSLQKVKRLFDVQKAGHTGSLDPLATGVLPLCFGEATKISQFLLDSDKSYRTKIKLGIKTATGDSEGEIISCAEVNITEQKLLQKLDYFRGNIQQIPSMYSALKHKGVPLYKLARKGETVERKVRDITVHKLVLLDFTGDELELEIHCTKGTYIRTIADDLGDMLDVGAHITELRRLASGPFTLEHSVSMEQLQNSFEQESYTGTDRFLIATDMAVKHLEKVVLPTITAAYVRQGQAVIARHLPSSGLVRLYDEDNFMGIGTILDDGRVAPKRLLT